MLSNYPSASRGLWILDTYLTKSDLYQAVNNAASRLGEPTRPFHRSGLPVSNNILLYKQLIHPMMDYASHIWKPAPSSGIWKSLNSSIFAFVKRSGRKSKFTRNFFGTFLAEHIIALTESSN